MDPRNLSRAFAMATMLVLTTEAAFAATVVIQPSSQDAYVTRQQPNAVHGSASTATRMFVQSSTPNPRWERALVQFAIPIPAFSTITSATLDINQQSAPVAARTHGAHRINASWLQSTVKWFTMPAFTASPTSTAAVGTSKGFKTFTVTTDVQGMVNTPSTNHGWLIVDQNELVGNDEVGYVTLEENHGPDIPKRPILTINFTAPSCTTNADCQDANPCTINERCEAGHCAVDSNTCDDSNACTDDICDPQQGCLNPIGECNDGFSCTTDACTPQGGCTHTPVAAVCQHNGCQTGTCVADQNNENLDPVTGCLVSSVQPNGSACNDQDGCTVGDQCQSGECVSGPPTTCTPQDDCHTAGTCDPQSGLCSNPVKPDGSGCTDNNACTQTDQCSSGTCTGTNPVICTALDQCHNVGTCNTGSGVCSNPNKPDGSACADGNACTQTDTCTSGSCTGGNPVICSPLDQCHNAGTCDTGSGLCSNPAKPDGSGCSDGDACTQTDTCTAGSCNGANPVVCTPLDQCHNTGTCSPGTGLCSNPNKPDGTTCSDNDACTQTDTCTGGSCTGANPVICTALDQCHDVGTCNTGNGVCSNPNKPNGSACNDNDACTQTDTCAGGSCTGGNPVVCTPLDQCHNAGTCNTGSGICSDPAKPDGSACSDNDACTQTDTCTGGSCAGANPVICTALDQCHDVGTCSPGSGVCSDPNKPNGSACNDNDACTQTDSCTGGSCTGGNPVVCTPLDGCHVAGTCDTQTGNCSNPTAGDGTSCSDGNTCTLSDTCSGGQCIGNPITCGDGTVQPSCNEECDTGAPSENCTAQCRFVCGPAPQAGCRKPVKPKKAVLVIKNKTPDKRDALLWKWVKGAATTLPELGTPLTTTGYTLCVYDSSGNPQPLLLAQVPPDGTCAGKPCWKTVKNGFKYKDKELTPDGILFLLEKAGAAGAAKIIVRGKGTLLGPPMLPLTTPVTAQLKKNDDPGLCWDANYSVTIKNLPELFKAKAD